MLINSPHKKTLFHTCAHFRGCSFCGQVISGNKNAIFLNEVKDLACFIQSLQKLNLQKNQILRKYSEGSVLEMHMYFLYDNTRKLQNRKLPKWLYGVGIGPKLQESVGVRQHWIGSLGCCLKSKSQPDEFMEPSTSEGT